MGFSLLVVEGQQITKDKNKITMINNLLKDVVIPNQTKETESCS